MRVAASARGGGLTEPSGSITWSDAASSLKQPIMGGFDDARTAIRLCAAKHVKLMNGDVKAALIDEARLITSARFARESLGSYRRIERLIDAHPAALGHHRPEHLMPERLVLFVGQSRSGHSLVGSLIDAHPDAVIAHELHALKHLAHGATLTEVCRAIQLNARLFDLIGRAYTGYDYQVEGQWQGRHRRLAVAGDKKGNGTTRLLRRHPGALDDLDARLCIPLHLINVVRHPLDNIATKAMRTGVSVAEASRRFLANVRTLDAFRHDRPNQMKTVYLDDLIAAPETVLADLVTWLDLSPAEPGYLEACAARVFTSPKRTRDRVDWPDGMIDRLRMHFAASPALARFADEDR